MEVKFKKLGLAGTAIIQLSFIPQIYKIIKTQNVSGLSSGYYLILGLGCLLLLIYAKSNSDKIMNICHTWALVNIFIILFLIYIF